MGEKLNHFSHEEHPLILIQVGKKENDDDDHKEVCYGCQMQILGTEEAYSCMPCHFFLHKRCAELPLNIWHPLHSQHPLVLLKKPPYVSPTGHCDACRCSLKFFTYHCSYCQFDLDVTCAMMEGKFEEVIVELKFELECHEHPLILQQRPASFFCDACGIEEGKDSTYVCTICPFWIHRRCSSLPQIVKHKHHNHSLTLAYCIPEDYRTFRQKCTVCHSKIPQNMWVYYCGPCRYFVHVKCVKIINASNPIILCETTRDGESDKEDREDNCNQHWVKLPVATPVQELIKHFLLNGNDEGSSSSATNQNDQKIEEVIFHIGHSDLLCLSSSRKYQNTTNIGEEIQICDGCMEPIYVSDLHYSCFIDCGYFLHVTCSKLPDELHSISHPEHPLTLGARLKGVGWFFCDICWWTGNGLQYKCRTCADFRICIKCAIASLSASIVHKGHEHRLTRVEIESSNFVTCNACGYETYRFAFGCKDCDFYLDCSCALLSPTFKPKGHDHLLNLLYPPYFEHPDEFYCVICEYEINPNHWIYHCWECDYSLHPLCIPQFGQFKNRKFGRTLYVYNHSHPLTHVPEANFYKLICDGCGRNWEWKPGFECEACQFFICEFCAQRKAFQPNVSLLSLDE